jgi:hypothetical protein
MDDLPTPVVVSYPQFLEYRERRLDIRKVLGEDAAPEPPDVEPLQPAALESIPLLPRP